MTDEIRQIIRHHITASGLSQAEIARQIGLQPQEFNRALRDRGAVPVTWQRILEHFDLKVTAVPKDHQGS